MNFLEILVLELLAIYALASGTIASCEVSTLNHELLDDTMEARALVVQWLS